MKDPPRHVELPGKDALTVPIAKPPAFAQPLVRSEPNPIAQLNIPAKALAAAQDSLPGALDVPPGPPTLSQGSGSDGGSGTGTGPGSGREPARVSVQDVMAATAAIAIGRATM